LKSLAEEEGFEPPVALRPRLISKDATSPTLENSRDVASESADAGGPSVPPPPRLVAASDPVEEALAAALAGATAAGRWDIVAQLARELEARRLARAQVPTLDEARARRGS